MGPPPTGSELFGGVAALTELVLRMGMVAGVPLVIVGTLALTVATRRPRVLATAGVAVVGALAAVALRGKLSAHLGVSLPPAMAAFAAVGALAGATFPWAFPFAAAALPGALAGAELPLAGRAELGAAVGGLITGLLGLAVARVLVATVSSLAGGVLLGLGLLATFGDGALARELAGRPAALVGFALVAGIAGAALQLSTSPAAPAARSPVSQP